MLTFLHASDLHFGRHFRPLQAEAFLASVIDLAPDLLVLSGDFTQRAKAGEYRAAKAFIDRLPDIPQVLTPGNHDVPLYRVWERLFAPLAKYRRYIRASLDEVIRIPGATVVGLNSTAPLGRITNGRLTQHQLELLSTAFRDAPSQDLRVLVTHHHFLSARDGVRDRPLPRAPDLVRVLEKLGTDLVLGGHIHRGYKQTSSGSSVPEGGGSTVLFVQSGTTTSTRGRAAESGGNSFNVICISENQIEVRPYHYAVDRRCFDPQDPQLFPRTLPSLRTAIPLRSGDVAQEAGKE